MPDRWLVVDDIRRVGDVSYFADPPKVTHVETAEEGIAALTEGEFDWLWLDHDLGRRNGEIITIMPLVDWLCERAFNGDRVPITQIVVHSANPVGARTMMQVLERQGYKVGRSILPS